MKVNKSINPSSSQNFSNLNSAIVKLVTQNKSKPIDRLRKAKDRLSFQSL